MLLEGEERDQKEQFALKSTTITPNPPYNY